MKVRRKSKGTAPRSLGARGLPNPAAATASPSPNSSSQSLAPGRRGQARSSPSHNNDPSHRSSLNGSSRNSSLVKFVFNLGLHNVNGFHRKEAESKRYSSIKAIHSRKLDIVILTETHAPNEASGDSWALPNQRNNLAVRYFTSKAQRTASNGFVGGVGFLIRAGLKVESFTAVNHRLAELEVEFRGRTFVVIGAYAPTDHGTSGSTDVDRAVFFNQLDEHIADARTRMRSKNTKSRIIVGRLIFNGLRYS